jgi:L,D-transpeptidase ErfK/SrfK
VIGELRLYRIRPGDTLMDLARYFDLGYNEIVEANPAIDPWVPPVGATILLPTQWVLPCCSYEGVVVNIPEMRLFFYRRSDDPGRTIVHTFPVGLGRDEWRTPRGKFKVRGKTLNPQWNIPESIRREHITERGDHRRFIPGGAEDNPLGRHRIELTLPMYAIHGTNIPWGVGMQVSHGCIRLYPEDIERLFPLVRPGIPGEFTYQPVTIGTRDGAVYVEAHRDIYGYTPARYSEAMQAIERAGLGARVDRDLLVAVLEESVGIPTRVSPAEDVPGGRPAATPATLASRERLETDDHRVSRPHDDQARHD